MGSRDATMNKLVSLAACLVASASGYPMAFPDGPGAPPHGIAFPKPGADGGYGGDGYFQYINVPGPNAFEWGYKRGNPDHNREEYLSQKDHTFKAKLKWHDGYGGHGEHYYDYNHGDAGYKAAPKPAYHPGLHSEVKEQYVEAPAGDARI